MGSDAIALPALDWLATEGRSVGEVVAVFTQPDRPAGRGQRIQPNEIKLWAESRGLPVLQPQKFGEADRVQLAGFKPDLTLVMAYGHILQQNVIGTPRLATLNLHTSILPRYRGASPIQTAIACGETATGVTLMRMVLKLDAGPVADAERIGIDPLDTAASVGGKLALACVPLLARSLPRIEAGTQRFTPQEESAATYCRRLEKSDGVLDFHAPASALAGRINGLTPWPGCAVTIAGQAVKAGLADWLPVSGSPPVPGEVVGADAAGLLVGAGDGVLRMRSLQRAGGRMLPAAEFLRGAPVPPGTRIASAPMPALVASRPFAHARS